MAAFAAGTALAAGWALAPAITAAPYLPPARDFEQRLPAAERVTPRAQTDGHAGEGPVTHRTPVIAAPARFDAAGLDGELRPYELRGREAGGAWTPWTESADGSPVWFGGADEVQVRTRGWRPRGRFHYVNVSGDSTPAEEALTAARTAVNDVVAAASGLLDTEDAVADPPRPEWITRRSWGANADRGGCEPRTSPSHGRVRAAAVHHTVSAVDYTEAEAPGMVLAICRYHKRSLGWNDIGYNALVDRFGNIYEGREGGMSNAVIGAHMQGYNAQTTGVAVLGTHTKLEITRKTMAGLKRLLAWKLVKHDKTAEGKAKLISAGGSANRYPTGTVIHTKRIIGHRRTNFTECPGDALNRQLDALRRRVQRAIEANGGDSGGIG